MMRKNIFFLMAIAIAAALWMTDPAYGKERLDTHIRHKFVRGMTNTLTGWAEMPKQVVLHTKEGPPILGSVQGLVEGIGLSLARTTAGLYEVVTFFIPFPWHYEPLFEPEYVWQQETDFTLEQDSEAGS